MMAIAHLDKHKDDDIVKTFYYHEVGREVLKDANARLEVFRMKSEGL